MPRPLSELAAEAAACTACPLWRNATRTVFGEGDPAARMMLVGEQPGDAEDRAGRPFVGPAGRILERALADAGLARDALYLTNAVKHFKWEARGRRRLHKTPSPDEVRACSRWLEGEIAALRPELLVCLGATATHALLGGSQALAAVRGRVIARTAAAPLLATVHPSYVLRVPASIHGLVYKSLVADLRVAADFLGGAAKAAGEIPGGGR